MAIQISKTLAVTAVGGLLAGLVGCGGEQKTAETPAGGAHATTDTTAASTSEAAGEKHGCAGKNGCKPNGGCGGKTETPKGDASPTPNPGTNPQ